jgi:hypothetical protein
MKKIDWTKRKKRKEIDCCQELATELNRRDGTDYRAEASDREPADVRLVSESGNFPHRLVQVVSIPLHTSREFRDDNHNIESLRERLMEGLRTTSLKQLYVNISLTCWGEAHGLDKGRENALRQTIIDQCESVSEALRIHHTHRFPEQLAGHVECVCLCYVPAIKTVDVGINHGGGLLPEDGRWIEEGIKLKTSKYGGQKAVKDLILVIDASAFVDPEQVTNFLQTHFPSTLPFAEVWLVSPWGYVVSLKRAT